MLHRQIAVAATLIATGAIALGTAAVSHAEKIGGNSVQNGTNPKKKCDVRGGITLKAGQTIKFNQGTIKVGDQTMPTHDVASCNKKGTQYCEKTVVNGKTVSVKCVAARVQPPKLPQEPIRPETTTASPGTAPAQPMTTVAEPAPVEVQPAPAASVVARPVGAVTTFTQIG